jgi:hypothetical protein
MPMDGNEIGIIKEMSPRKVLEQLRMKLKGFEFDYEKNDYTKISDPLMNDKGISKYLSIMSSVITDLVTFSNYKDDEINLEMKHDAPPDHPFDIYHLVIESSSH